MLLWFIGNYIYSNKLMLKKQGSGKERKKKNEEGEGEGEDDNKFCMELCKAAFQLEIGTRF
jgi:hypothetical protein